MICCHDLHGLVLDSWLGQLRKAETTYIEDMIGTHTEKLASGGLCWLWWRAPPATWKCSFFFLMYSTRWLVWTVGLSRWTVSVYKYLGGGNYHLLSAHIVHTSLSFVFVKSETLTQLERRDLSPGICPLTSTCSDISEPGHPPHPTPLSLSLIYMQIIIKLKR